LIKAATHDLVLANPTCWTIGTPGRRGIRNSPTFRRAPAWDRGIGRFWVDRGGFTARGGPDCNRRRYCRPNVEDRL